MSELDVELEGFVAGDDLEIAITVTDLPAAIAVGWLTVKRHARQSDESAALSKIITTTDQPGTGQVETPGGPNVPGKLRFDLTPADTVALGSDRHVYDIQIRLENGKVYTVEKGVVQLTSGVTDATEPS